MRVVYGREVGGNMSRVFGGENDSVIDCVLCNRVRTGYGMEMHERAP